MNIRTLTDDQRSKLRTAGGVAVRIAVISEDRNDRQPVKGFYLTRTAWTPATWSENGAFLRSGLLQNLPDSLDLSLPPTPVQVAKPVYMRINKSGSPYPTASSDNHEYTRFPHHPADPQAFIKIVDFSEVMIDEGVKPDTEPSFKLVRV